jgi:hypothetical protein
MIGAGHDSRVVQRGLRAALALVAFGASMLPLDSAGQAPSAREQQQRRQYELQQQRQWQQQQQQQNRLRQQQERAQQVDQQRQQRQLQQQQQQQYRLQQQQDRAQQLDQRRQQQQSTPQNQAPIQPPQNRPPVEPPKNQVPIPVMSPKERDEYHAAFAERKAQRERMEAEAATAAKAKKDEAQRQVAEVRAAKKAEDADAKKAALADGARARSNKVDTDICGVPLGKVLDLPDCATVGRLEEGVFGKQMVSETTCISYRDDGSSSIRFGNGACPAWTRDILSAILGGDGITAKMKADVLVAVSIVFQATNPGTLGALSAVEASQKQLRAKYGKPTKADMITVTNGYGATVRNTPNLEWRRPGLHVQYEVGTSRDSITIELESAAKARAEQEEAEEAAGPRL